MIASVVVMVVVMVHAVAYALCVSAIVWGLIAWGFD